MCLIWSLCFRIRCHAIHSRHQHGLGSSFQRKYFLCAGLRFVSSQRLGFSSLPPLRHVADGAKAQSVAVRYSPFFDSSLCDGLLPHVNIQPFVQMIQIRRFTRLHSLCWLTPSTFIPPSFRLSMCLGFRLVRAGFGYAVTLFGFRLVRAILFGVWIPCSGRKHHAFDQSSPLSLSNSIPMHLLLWVFVGFWFAQGEIYFRAEYLILNLCLNLWFFKNVEYMEKHIRKHMRKRI